MVSFPDFLAECAHISTCRSLYRLTKLRGHRSPRKQVEVYY